MEKFKIKNNRPKTNSKLFNLFLFILIFILSLSSILTIQIKSYNSKKNQKVKSSSDIVISDTKNNDIEKSIQNQKTTIDESKQHIVENTEEIGFVYPLDGKIIVEYSDDILVYNETLDDWRLHLATDIKAEKGSIIKSISEGKIQKIYDDEIYGTTVEISHSNGYVSKYSNISLCKGLKAGDTVKKGMLIGILDKNPPFESSMDLHLHFEIYEYGKKIDPMLIIYE